jgi:hypothetical protein
MAADRRDDSSVYGVRHRPFDVSGADFAAPQRKIVGDGCLVGHRPEIQKVG